MGESLEWADVIRDLDALEEVEVIQQNKRFLLRNEIQGTCGKVFQAVGVKLPQTVRQADIIAVAIILYLARYFVVPRSLRALVDH